MRRPTALTLVEPIIGAVSGRLSPNGPGGRFCRWLREFYCAFDPAYLTLTRQAIKVKLHPIIWDIERAVAALLFKNNDYEAQLCLYASRTNNDALSKRAAPRRFLVLWSGVARTRRCPKGEGGPG